MQELIINTLRIAHKPYSKKTKLDESWQEVLKSAEKCFQAFRASFTHHYEAKKSGKPIFLKKSFAGHLWARGKQSGRWS